MEADELITFTNTERVLAEYAEQLATLYKSNLKAEGKYASGALINSVQGLYTRDGNTFTVSLRLEDYWKYVEYGRKPGKFPPPNAIRRWVEIKPVIPRPMANGKLPTIKQLTYLISRKIAEEGITPTYALRNTSEALTDAFRQRIIDALTADLNNAVTVIFQTYV